MASDAQVNSSRWLRYAEPLSTYNFLGNPLLASAFSIAHGRGSALLGRFDDDGSNVGLNGPADGDLSHVHQPEKGKDPIGSDTEKAHGFSFQGGQPTALPGFRQRWAPPATG
jgi:hypothetical protein